MILSTPLGVLFYLLAAELVKYLRRNFKKKKSNHKKSFVDLMRAVLLEE